MKKEKNRLLWVICNWEEIITIIAVFAMFTVCCVAVIMRYVFSYGIAWSTDICNICLIYVTFVGSAAAYKRNLHFGMDFLTDRFKPKARYILKMILNAVLILLFAYLFYLSIVYTMGSKKLMQISRISYKYLNFATILGFGSMSVHSVIYFIMGFVNHDKYYNKFVISQAQALEEESKEVQ